MFFLTFAAFLSIATGTWAREEDDGDLHDLILPQTRTHLGRLFYRAFVKRWKTEGSLHGYHITLREELHAGGNTLISVYLKDRIILRAVLERRGSKISAIADEAVKRARKQHVIDRLTHAATDSEDLAGSDF